MKKRLPHLQGYSTDFVESWMPQVVSAGRAACLETQLAPPYFLPSFASTYKRASAQIEPATKLPGSLWDEPVAAWEADYIPNAVSDFSAHAANDGVHDQLQGLETKA